MTKNRTSTCQVFSSMTVSIIIFLATDTENNLVMDRVGERVGNNQEIFSSMGDAILSGEIPLQSKVPSTRDILTVVLFIIMCIMIILFFVYQCFFFKNIF